MAEFLSSGVRVTGAAIDRSEMVRKVDRFNPARIILVERAEQSL